jgi:hypothetical protein
MSGHKEQALDEKRYHFRLGATCVTGFSEVIHISSLDSFDDSCRQSGGRSLVQRQQVRQTGPTRQAHNGCIEEHMATGWQLV